MTAEQDENCTRPRREGLVEGHRDREVVGVQAGRERRAVPARALRRARGRLPCLPASTARHAATPGDAVFSAQGVRHVHPYEDGHISAHKASRTGKEKAAHFMWFSTEKEIPNKDMSRVETSREQIRSQEMQ